MVLRVFLIYVCNSLFLNQSTFKVVNYNISLSLSFISNFPQPISLSLTSSQSQFLSLSLSLSLSLLITEFPSTYFYTSIAEVRSNSRLGWVFVNLVFGVCVWLAKFGLAVAACMSSIACGARFHWFQLTDGLGEGFLIFYWVGFLGFNSGQFGWVVWKRAFLNKTIWKCAFWKAHLRVR